MSNFLDSTAVFAILLLIIPVLSSPIWLWKIYIRTPFGKRTHEHWQQQEREWKAEREAHMNEQVQLYREAKRKEEDLKNDRLAEAIANKLISKGVFLTKGDLNV